MSKSVLQTQMQDGRAGRIMEAINEAEAVLGRQEISFPRIAVLGDESTGKSSLMESICNVPFPRGDRVTTKCATQVRMQRRPGPWAATAWTDGVDSNPRRHETTARSPQELTAIISDLQSKEIELANKKNPSHPTEFSTVPITIFIEAEDVVDLTLTDLPGYFQTTHLDKSKDPGKAQMGIRDVERVKTTLLDYLEDDLTILLVVVQANSNLKNANIFRLIHEFKDELEPDRLESLKSRTIYCFTKCDLIAPGKQRPAQDMEEVLSNQGDFAAIPHGWYAVVNNLSESENPATRLKLDRDEEEKFFSSTLPFNKPNLFERCGTRKLVAKLSGILASEIARLLPTMESQCRSALSLLQQQLSAMGPVPSQARELDVEFALIVKDIHLFFKNSMDARYQQFFITAKDYVPDVDPELLKICELGRLWNERCEAFRDQIIAERPKFQDPGYQQELLGRMQASSDGKLHKVLPDKEIVINEVRLCANKWKRSAEMLCNDIARLAKLALGVFIDIRTNRYERVQSVLRSYLSALIDEQKDHAHVRLCWHFVDEMVRPNTFVDTFYKLLRKKPRPGLGEDDNTRTMYVSVLEALLPTIEARYVDNVVRTITTHIMDVPLMEPMTNVEVGVQPKYRFIAEKIRGGHDLEDLLELNSDITLKRTELMERIKKLENLQDALVNQPSKSRPKSNGVYVKATAEVDGIETAEVDGIETAEVDGAETASGEESDSGSSGSGSS